MTESSRVRDLDRSAHDVRWWRRPLAGGLVTAAATLLLMAGSVLAWRVYSEWTLGRIELTTEGAPLIAQVLAESSDLPLGEPFDLVTRAILALPAGEYRLRVNGMGRLGRTYRFAVNRGETQTHSISLNEGRLLGGELPPGTGFEDKPGEVPRPMAPVTSALELTAGKSDLLEWSRGSLVRRDGTTGNPIWDAFGRPKTAERGRGHDPAHWLRDLYPGHRRAEFVEPAADYNGDGTRDVLCCLPGNAAFLALSGTDGSMLWNYVAELDRLGGPQPEGPVLDIKDKPSMRSSFFLGPAVLGGIDRDGSPDVIATISFGESANEFNERLAKKKPTGPYNPPLFRRVIVAVSGRTGVWRWTYPIDKSFRQHSIADWRQSAAMVGGKSTSFVAITDATKWTGLDPASGRPKFGPLELGFVPIRPVQYADLNADGDPEILAVGISESGPTLAAFDFKTGRTLWRESGALLYEESAERPFPDWPVVVDLDDDGRPEIVVPNFDMMPPLSGYRGMRLLDGLTGKTRWARPMRPETVASDGLSQIAPAPDLDGDGARDLITVSTFKGKNRPKATQARADEPNRVYVDAISGKDGRPLWWWRTELTPRIYARLWKPLWFGRGSDGWPLLAVPIGGKHADGVEVGLRTFELEPPVVHLLQASTGREVHTITGLTKVKLADLDGDGLADLWGEVQGELRAFRGEAPEAWRALGQFHPPTSLDGQLDAHENPTVDFDGDSIGDALISRVQTPGESASQTTGSHTALARSGRDGHTIWKTVLDPRERWFESSYGEAYNLWSFPQPNGDFDGDGTPDVVVQKFGWRLPTTANRQTASLPLQVLSGRRGRLLWQAGPLPPGFEAQGYAQIHWVETHPVEAGGKPDLIVRHGNSYAKPGTPAPAPAWRVLTRPSLARVSGRDGRILWDVNLADVIELESSQRMAPDGFGDLNGDGALDVLLTVPPAAPFGGSGAEVLAVSLRDGKKLWSRTIPPQPNGVMLLRVGDLDGDNRADVVSAEVVLKTQLELEIRALDGRDGKVRWTWSGGAVFQNSRFPPSVILARLTGDGARQICIYFKEAGGKRRIVVIDGMGKEIVHRDLPGDESSELLALDLNGDERDEILILHGEKVHALGPDLQELWSWPVKSGSIDMLIPATPARASEVIIPPALSIDGTTGEPRWTGQRPLVLWPRQFHPSLLDRGNSARPPLLLGDGLGATVCRVAIPTTPQGTIAPARGARVQPALVAEDPRWTRPLPWLLWLKGPIGPWGFLAAGGLAFVNAVVPVLILRLAAGGRPWSVRALMALPVAAAVPLMVFLTLQPALPVGSGPLLASEQRLFFGGTLAGLPIVVSLALVIFSLAHGRWHRLAVLLSLSIAASLTIAAGWIWLDKKSMPSIEHYGRAGWYLILVPGAYAASVLMLIGWAGAVLFVVTKRNRQQRS